MLLSTSFLLLSASASVVSSTLDNGSTCEYYDGFSTGEYGVSNYVEENYLPDTASQCVTITGGDEDSISYRANFTFNPTSDWMVGFPGVSKRNWERRSLAEHLSVPTTWEWSMNEAEDLKASVNYYMAGNQGCLPDLSWTISVWLGTFGISQPGDYRGQPGDLVGDATIAGVAFDIFRVNRPTGAPFVAWIFQARETQTKFEGDLVDFLKWPVENQNARIGCIWSVQAGPDIYGGTDGLFETSRYSVQQILAT